MNNPLATRMTPRITIGDLESLVFSTAVWLSQSFYNFSEPSKLIYS